MDEEFLKGYLKDARGNLVPITSIKEIDLLRDSLVLDIANRAAYITEILTKFKKKVFEDIAAFVELSAEKYDVVYGGRKGNVTLASFSGEYKVTRAISEYIVFDERLQVAKQLIDECIKEWAEGARIEIKSLINYSFETDKQGKLNTERILSLRRIAIDDPKWKRAMEAISDSLTVTGSKSYVRVYKRNEKGTYQQVNLDLAGI